MAGFRLEKPQDVLLRALAQRTEQGNPGPFSVPGGGGVALTREEQEMLRRVARQMMRRRGIGGGSLFGRGL